MLERLSSISDSLGSHGTKNKQGKNNLLLVIPESGFDESSADIFAKLSQELCGVGGKFR
jgi:hypothetical protein